MSLGEGEGGLLAVPIFGFSCLCSSGQLLSWYGSLTVFVFLLLVGVCCWSVGMELGSSVGFLELLLVAWVLLLVLRGFFCRSFRFVWIVPVGLCFSSPVAWGVL